MLIEQIRLAASSMVVTLCLIGPAHASELTCVKMRGVSPIQSALVNTCAKCMVVTLFWNYISGKVGTTEVSIQVGETRLIDITGASRVETLTERQC